MNYRPAPAERFQFHGKSTFGQFFFAAEDLPDMAAWFKKHYPADAELVIKRAGQIVSHDFTWLCPNSPEYGGKIAWTSNFSDGRQWPATLYSELDYTSDARLGDVRELWELNRHQYFAILGKAYTISGDDVYVDEFLAQMQDWITHNPPGYGINWLHSQEVALRAVAWCWAYWFFADAPKFTDDLKALFFSSLYAHADFVRWHLSDKAVTHNHLISEVCGLAIIGILFPQLDSTGLWRERGVQLFLRELDKQVWEDGLDGELSTNYHCFVLDSLLQLSLLMKINHLPIPTKALTRIEAMIEALMHFIRPDGSLPLIGDSDNGRAFRLAETIPEDRRAYLAIGAVLYDRGDFRQVAGDFFQEAFWLLGVYGARKFSTMPGNLQVETEKFFLPGGLWSCRSSWDKNADFLLLRGGPTQLRKGVSISHNHADLLSFELAVSGVPVLVDPGLYLYGQDDAWRFHFRKTMAHNTLVVDAQDQFEVCATRFGIPRLPVSTCHNYLVSDHYRFVDMTHSGYDGVGIGHRRRLFWRMGRYLLILDDILGEGSHQLDLCFHFNPLLEVLLAASTAQVKTSEGIALCILETLGDHLETTRLAKGAKQPIEGWYAPRYGQKVPSTALFFSGRKTLPARLATLVNLRPQRRLSGSEVGDGAFRLDAQHCFDLLHFDASGCRFELNQLQGQEGG